MQNWDWQTVVTMMIVGVAVLKLLRGTVRFFSNAGGGCSTGCGSCSAAPAHNAETEVEQGFVPLDSLMHSPHEESSRIQSS